MSDHRGIVQDIRTSFDSALNLLQDIDVRARLLEEKIQQKIDNLRHLKAETESMPGHNYPVGELPALCTPRMYRALHDHTSRAYAVGPPQFTAGAVKDLISESARIREKTDFRKLRLPQLDKLPMDRPDTV